MMEKLADEPENIAGTSDWWTGSNYKGRRYTETPSVVDEVHPQE